MWMSLMSKWKLRRLITGWTEYREAVLAEREPGAATARQEEDFLALKARIATLLPLLVVGTPAGAAAEAQNHSRGMTELLNRYRSLGVEGAPVGRDREEFERRWHEHFVFLNKLKGMKFGQDKLPSMRRSSAAVPTGIPARRYRRGLPGVWMIKFAFQLAILAAILYGIAWILGVQKDTSTGRLAVGHTRSLSELSAASGRVLVSVWNGVTSFIAPVVKAYGPESTIVLLGLLLLALGYWTFVRRS
jgi:hypothetical protein